MECPKECGSCGIIFEATGNSAVVFDAMQGLANKGVLVLASVTCGDNTIEVHADRINLDFVLGKKVTVGTVNANREYFESGGRDMAQAQAEYPGWLEKLLPNLVNGLVNFEEFLRQLTADRSAIKVYCEVADPVEQGQAPWRR
jgi:glucose 1-dehydrogenase